LPAGIGAGEIAWPTPKKIPIGTLANYGYEKTVLLPVPLTVAPGFAGSSSTSNSRRPGWCAARNAFRKKVTLR
jgi:DsbC/DsbD-like thiol-disulfide interchange protein